MCSKRDICALQTSLSPLLYVEVTVVIEKRAVVCSKKEIWALQTSLSPLLYVEVTVVIERRAVVCSKSEIWALQTSLIPLLLCLTLTHICPPNFKYILIGFQ